MVVAGSKTMRTHHLKGNGAHLDIFSLILKMHEAETFCAFYCLWKRGEGMRKKKIQDITHCRKLKRSVFDNDFCTHKK